MVNKTLFSLLAIILILITINSATATYNDDFSYWWNYDSGSLLDSFGVYNLTNNGADTNSSGIINEAYNFVALNTDYMNGSTSLPAFGADNFSLYMWIYINSFPDHMTLMAKQASDFSDANGWEWFLISTGEMYFARHDSGIGSKYRNSVDQLKVGQWYFLIVTYNVSGGVKLYINATEVTYAEGTYSDFSTLTNTEQFNIGVMDAITRPFDGTIDEPAIAVGVVLSQANITTLYAAGAPTEAQHPPFTSTSVVVTSLFPADNRHTVNGTVTNPQIFSYDLTLTGVAEVNCSLQLANGSGFVNHTTNTENTTGAKLINSTALNAPEIYTWRIYCTDGATTGFSENRTLTIDRVNPLYDFKNNSFLNESNNTILRKGFDEPLQLINVSLSDTYVFGYEILFRFQNGTLLHNATAENLTSTIENISFIVDHSNITTNELITAQFNGSDDHTAKNIPDYPYTITQQYIEYRPPSGTTLKIESVEGNLAGITTTKLLDRYTFTLDWGNARNEHEIVFSCSDAIYDRGDLYEFPSFVCGEHWLDFVPVGMTRDDFEDIIIKHVGENRYSINFKTVEKTAKLEFASIGGLNKVSITITYNYKVLDVYNHTFSAVNSTDDVFGNESFFNTGNLTPIEKMQLNFSVKSSETLNENITLWYTAAGNTPCAPGNRNQTCNAYPNYVEFKQGQLTTTYDGAAGNIGDSINCTYTGNNTAREYSCLIDEHYNPNVFKWYNAEYNFSDVKYQAGANQQLRKNNQLKIEVDETILPLNADFYKLDFRVMPVGGADDTIEAYACNSTYTTGNPTTSPYCTLIAALLGAQLQDDGEKFRAIFTNSLVETLGDINYIILRSDETNGGQYYSLKTYAATNTNHTQRWAYSTNKGVLWTNASDGYETELNINWFYTDHTSFIAKIQVDTTTAALNSSLFNMTWDIDPTVHLPPLIVINTPEEDDELRATININWTVAEPDEDNYTVDIYLNDTPLAINVTNDITTLTLNTNNHADGDYTLLLIVTDNATNPLSGNDSHHVTINNLEVIDCITINRSNEDYTLQNNINATGDCITINAHNTTLDCDAYTLTGNGSGIGINLRTSHNLTIEQCIITEFDTGINTNATTNSTLKENTLHTQHENNLHFQANSTSNFIYNNYIGAATNHSLQLLNGSNNNYFYNNLINATILVNQATSVSNYYNITLQAGTPTHGGGALIGGNYWTNATGTGFSDTCTDADENAICDDPYNLSTGAFAIDYHPLTNAPASMFFDCGYNPTPFTTIPQKYLCDLYNVLNKTFECYGITKSPVDDSIFDITPRQQQLVLVGATTGFPSTPALAENQFVKVEFSTKRLKSNQETVFQALCVNTNESTDRLTFNRTLTPRFTDADLIGETLISGAKNTQYYILGGAILFFLLLITFMVVRELRKR